MALCQCAAALPSVPPRPPPPAPPTTHHLTFPHTPAGSHLRPQAPIPTSSGLLPAPPPSPRTDSTKDNQLR